MKNFNEMTKAEIIANFENRWNVEGYREAIEELAEVANANDCAGFEKLSDFIAEKFHQGINTVVNDIARL